MKKKKEQRLELHFLTKNTYFRLINKNLDKIGEGKETSMALSFVFLLMVIGGLISLALVIGMIVFFLYTKKKEKEKEEK